MVESNHSMTAITLKTTLDVTGSRSFQCLYLLESTGLEAIDSALTNLNLPLHGGALGLIRMENGQQRPLARYIALRDQDLKENDLFIVIPLPEVCSPRF
jgi:hypothetical protein